jgi:hypothetical protein
MPHRMSVDRFEGKSKQIAVLVGEDDTVVNVPRSLLPEGVEPGAVVTLTLALDAEATAAIAAETKALQDELKGRDPGGDLAL